MSSVSITGRRWVLRSAHVPDDIVTTLASARGISLSAPSRLTDPRLLGDAEEAAERLQSAVTKGERIGIVGDYDADGLTGTAQMVRYLHRRGVSPTVVLPHREHDGCGLKRHFIGQLHSAAVTLLLTVDMGVSDAREVSYARSLGMDVIILDHHHLSEHLPSALIVHPVLRGSDHGGAHLSGSGVVYTFLRLLEGGEEWRGSEEDLTLAAVGTIADVVPLLGDNRVIAQRGVAILNTPRSSPLSVLAGRVRGESPLTSRDVAYRIAPRINAAGRVRDPWFALEALLQGGSALEELERLNTERQEMTEEAMTQILPLLDPSAALLSVVREDVPVGILGLLAGKISERFARPSVVGTGREQRVVASLRSVPAYDIITALERCAAHLHSYGGHARAAGCVCARESWESFTMALEKDAATQLRFTDLVPSLIIDCPMVLSDLTADVLSHLRVLEPHGEGNPEPRFLFRGVPCRERRRVGTLGKHLQCRLGETKAVGFGLGDLADHIPAHCDVVGRLSLNRWNGREEVQIVIEDVRPSSERSAMSNEQKR